MNENVVKLDFKLSIKAIIFLTVLLIGISIESRMLQIILRANDTLLVNMIEKTIFLYLLMAVGLTEYGLNFKDVLRNEGDYTFAVLISSLLGSFLIAYILFEPKQLSAYLLPLLSTITPNHSLTAEPRAITTIILALVIIPLHNVFLYFRFLFQGLLNNEHNNLFITTVFTLAVILLHNFFSNQLLFITITGLYFILLYLKTKSTMILLINQFLINLVVLLKFI